jgi:hypothetical protein
VGGDVVVRSRQARVRAGLHEPSRHHQLSIGVRIRPQMVAREPLPRQRIRLLPCHPMRNRSILVVALAVLAGASTVPAHASRPAIAASHVVRGRTAGVASTAHGGVKPPTIDAPNPLLGTARPTRTTAASGAARTGTRTPVVDGLDADLIGPIGATSPGDPTGATGPSRVVAAVNVKVAVYDRSGAQLLAPLRLRGINSMLQGTEETDPKVVYDAYSNVFVLAFLTYTDREGYIDVVTIPSATAEDTGTWCLTHMVGDEFHNGRHEFADYPSLGFTSNRVTVTTNNFGFHTGVFRYAQAISMPKAALYDPTCSTVVPIKVAGGAQTRNPDGSKAFTLMTAQSIGAAPTDQFLVSLEPKATSANLVLFRLRVVSGTLQVRSTAERVKRALLPPYGYQCGSSGQPNTWWDTGDLRLTSAFYDAVANRLYTATSALGNAGGGAPESVIRWWEVAPGTKLGQSSVLRQGTVGAPNHDAAWPAIATNDAGTVFLTYARAGLKECLSMYSATVPVGTTTPIVALVRAGEARYEFGPGLERWGDFSAANRDPVTPADVAVFGAFAAVTGGKPTDAFRSHGALLADVP